MTDVRPRWRRSQKLERCEGHLLNWYNTRTLEPLQPQYVSTVDSGNLIASLWVLAQACRGAGTTAATGGACASRVWPTPWRSLSNAFPRITPPPFLWRRLRGLFHEESSGIEVMERIRLAAEPARKLTESLRWSISETEERTYWFTRLEEQVQTWIQYFDRYLRWADVLSAPPDEFLRPLGEDAIPERRRLLRELPSWGDLSLGEDGHSSRHLAGRRR